MNQQALWTYLNPYDRRFGPEFFKQVPEQPGVYWMQDSKRSLLYIGRSSNLQKRLSSYRFIHPHSCPKKLLQLMEDVRSLGWSPTKTEAAALLLEQQIIKRHPPHHINSLTRDKVVYVTLAHEYPVFHLRLCHERPQGDDGALSFGLFRNRINCQKAVSSMARLLWWLGHHGQFFALPQPLAKSAGPSGQKVEVQLDQKSFGLLLQLLRDYWEGENKDIVELFEDSLLGWCRKDPLSFFTKWVQTDLATLKAFFNTGPVRNKKMRELFQLPSEHIEKEWIDDLWRFN